MSKPNFAALATELKLPHTLVPEAERQYDILASGTVQIIPEDAFAKKLLKSLANGTPLKVKLGADPTAPDLHLGHVVVLDKLRQFQDLGHHVQLLIGDFTAAIGDPSGRNKTRPPLTRDQIEANAKTYAEQVYKVLDKDKTELMYNSTWSTPLGMADIIRLLSQVTVAQLMTREDFHNRYSNNLPIAMHELLYPIMQGYDSVAMHSDVELGGTDQTFNCLMGRELQRQANQPEQVVITLPLLVGLDGVDKMSKSKGNYVAIADAPADMFGKVMSVSDALMWAYYDLFSGMTAAEVAELKARVEGGTFHPMEAKKQIAALIVTRFHDAAAAKAARDDFETRFSKNAIPEDLPEETVVLDGASIGLPALMTKLGFTQSNSEGVRLIQQGGVKIDGAAVTDFKVQLSAPSTFVLQAGKRRMARVTLNA
ncbi:MAG: tyrosine--tRNA ligase [Proteobacteria bacterium]|nr:tyrosine--tRNA ligase [Pseudomonadota bacterium]